MELETSLRRALGIPDEAARVLFLGETSHWDPNWLLTSGEYYRLCIQRILDRAVSQLLADPRRVYGIESIFFLRMYWERTPAQRDAVRSLVNQGRLRLLGSGVTTPDTLLPHPEALFRDYLIGQEWLRRNGMTQEPRLAFFPDSFGHSPALPSLLTALGIEQVAISRIDGMFFPGADLRSRRAYPVPGSSAERLLNLERSLDFRWVGPDGAEVLCHWNAFGYFQGDDLTWVGLPRLLGLGVHIPAEPLVARHVDQYVKSLQPLARTPYLFCPIGGDFVPPVPGLTAVLERYNRQRYPRTGTWVLNAGLDDYLALVRCHQADLPVLSLDPNPYWTGFYASRPSLKARCKELTEALLLAEKLSLLKENATEEAAVASELEEAWYWNAVSNHHDFITGTSPDRVCHREQVPRLEAARDDALRVLSRATSRLAPFPLEKPARGPSWRQEEGRLMVEIPGYRFTLDAEAGGCIVACQALEHETPCFVGPANDLVLYRDTGGLWRMGQELRGGKLQELARASDGPARLEVRERDELLEVEVTSTLQEVPFTRWYWFRGDSPVVRMRVEGAAPRGTLVTCRFPLPLRPSSLHMDVPGGVVERPLEKGFDPTFWSVSSFVFARDAALAQGVALFPGVPGSVCMRPGGVLECVAHRNATHEKVFGMMPLPAFPAWGHDDAPHAFEYGLLLTGAGDWYSQGVHRLARRVVDPGWLSEDIAHAHLLAEEVVSVDHPDVQVLAVKPASRGGGLIARLYAPRLPDRAVALRFRDGPVLEAVRCDGLERDLERLSVEGGLASLELTGNFATVRLRTGA